MAAGSPTSQAGEPGRSPRIGSASSDLLVTLLALLGDALAVCRHGENAAAGERDAATFSLLVFALRHLSTLIVASRATGLPLALSLGRTPGTLLRVEVTLPEPRPLPAAPVAPAVLQAPSEPTAPPDGIERVPFHGDMIEVLVRGEDRWLPLRPLCDRLGVSVEGQLAKLKTAEWAVMKEIFTTGSDGKTYAMACLHLRSLAGWLFSIKPGKVKPEVREALVRYQREAADALYTHFAQMPAVALPGGNR